MSAGWYFVGPAENSSFSVSGLFNAMIYKYVIIRTIHSSLSINTKVYLNLTDKNFLTRMLYKNTY